MLNDCELYILPFQKGICGVACNAMRVNFRLLSIIIIYCDGGGGGGKVGRGGEGGGEGGGGRLL